MANLTITEQTVTSYRLENITAELTLNAGEKLADIPAVINYAQKTVPAGYRVKLYVDITGEVEKL